MDRSVAVFGEVSAELASAISRIGEHLDGVFFVGE